MEMRSITHLMIESGWQRQERVNAGKFYVEWTREGFMIDEDDITKLLNTKD